MLGVSRKKATRAQSEAADPSESSEAQLKPSATVSGAISLANVEAFYGTFRAVNNGSLEVQP